MGSNATLKMVKIIVTVDESPREEEGSEDEKEKEDKEDEICRL